MKTKTNCEKKENKDKSLVSPIFQSFCGIWAFRCFRWWPKPFGKQYV